MPENGPLLLKKLKRLKCSENSITVTPIRKWDFENEAVPNYAYGAQQPYKKTCKILFVNERLKIWQMMEVHEFCKLQRRSSANPKV